MFGLTSEARAAAASITVRAAVAEASLFCITRGRSIFPVADMSHAVTRSRQQDEGLLTRDYVQSSRRRFSIERFVRVLGRPASLIHTTPDGARDVDPVPNTRIYFFTGGQRADGSLPLKRNITQNVENPLDFPVGNASAAHRLSRVAEGRKGASCIRFPDTRSQPTRAAWTVAISRSNPSACITPESRTSSTFQLNRRSPAPHTRCSSRRSTRTGTIRRSPNA